VRSSHAAEELAVALYISADRGARGACTRAPRRGQGVRRATFGCGTRSRNDAPGRRRGPPPLGEAGKAAASVGRAAKKNQCVTACGIVVVCRKSPLASLWEVPAGLVGLSAERRRGGKARQLLSN